MDERNEIDEVQETQDVGTPESLTLLHFQGTAKDAVARYTHCAICGANLHFNYSTDFVRNVTQESARCPECGVKARHVLHRLQ